MIVDPQQPLVLLTGATGYVGGRLLRALEAAGHHVRCVARKPEYLKPKTGAQTEVLQADLLDPRSLSPVMAGVHTAYYLVHSMGASANFEETDRQAARNFADAAQQAGVRCVIYLGGLGEDGGTLSPHLRSRHEVGDILRKSGLSVIEFRASIIIGSGSLSFEMVRALVERLPVMTTPRWVNTPAQPIAIDDVIGYLVAALDLPPGESRIFEIGGSEQMSYAGIMREYARQRGLHRWMIPVPALTPRISSLWLGLITPLYARIGRKLIDSIRNSTVVRDDSALRCFSIRPRSVREAVSAALRKEDQAFASTRWFDALGSTGPLPHWGGVRFGNRLIDSRTADVKVPPNIAFRAVERIGGQTGWYFADVLWRIRGALDLLVGGVGMRRGRRDPDTLCVGDALDCWRVEAFEPGRRLLLAAEMKLPGRAWLEFVVVGDAAGSVIRQTAMFDPVGLAGLAYWYLIYPLHRLVFAGMLRGIVRRAESS